MAGDNTQLDIDNTIEDNSVEVGNADTPSADLSGSEDTQAWQEIIDAKDSIIATYETQVKSLRTQIETLIRNGAVTESSKAPEPQQTRNALTGGFGKGVEGYPQGFGLADLGQEIGRKD